MPAVLLRAVMLAVAIPVIPDGADDLELPVQVTADGQAIDVGRGGLAAPCYADFDGDDIKDLLVGGGDGRLRVYHNYGTNGQPQFKEYTWFKVGPSLGRVPWS
jgi:hypothetical protein